MKIKKTSLWAFKAGDEYKTCDHYKHYEVIEYRLARCTKCDVLIVILLDKLKEKKK